MKCKKCKVKFFTYKFLPINVYYVNNVLIINDICIDINIFYNIIFIALKLYKNFIMTINDHIINRITIIN